MSQKRQELVETALRLFGEYGFHNTGIDRIAEEAGVSKRTMYQHFRSKEELILAVLKHYDGIARNSLMKAVEATGDTPYERLLGIFDVGQAWFLEKNFHGCIFINAISEYAEREAAISSACQSYKEQLLAFIEELARDANVPNSQQVAMVLFLLYEGATVAAQVGGNADSALAAKAAAKQIVDSALSSGNDSD